MQAFARGTGREALLALALIVVACFADWSDDWFSYRNAARYHEFEYANGAPNQIGGGGFGFSGAFFASFIPGVAGNRNSAIESVYGSPLGSPDRDGSDRNTGSQRYSGSQSASGFARSRSQQGMGLSSFSTSSRASDSFSAHSPDASPLGGMSGAFSTGAFASPY